MGTTEPRIFQGRAVQRHRRDSRDHRGRGRGNEKARRAGSAETFQICTLLSFTAIFDLSSSQSHHQSVSGAPEVGPSSDGARAID
jgi:hypothetical protein